MIPGDPSIRNFSELVRARMRQPDKVFVRNADGRTMTFAETWHLAGRIAGVLAANGVQPGDRVAVQVEKSPETIALFLGCLRAGAAYLPLNTAYTLAELEYFFADAGPRCVVAAPERLSAVAEVARRKDVATTLSLGERGDGSLMDAAEGYPPDFRGPTMAWDSLASILYTSGTTGRSKGAMLTHANLASNALALVDYWRLSASDVLIHALPVFHIHGLFVAINTLLLAGGTILFLPKFQPDEVLRLMPQATVMMGVPTFYTRLLAHPGLTREATASMRLFVSGSAPLLAESHRAFFERTGHAILERYGMTETNMNTSNPYDGDRLPGSVGLPLPGVDVRITDPEAGSTLPVGATGMIEVRGPNVFKGYWRLPEKTASEFRKDGFFITGDLGRIDARGYVWIVGRNKDMIITGGLNVYPKEVEDEIDAIAGVTESAVIGLPHPDFGEGVTAVVVAADKTLTEQAVLARLKDRLAKFKQPKRVVFVADLPRNTMGKVQKNALRDTYAGLYA
ncbi:MAG: malonyl-CoA synthase [Bauldia sp.]